MKTINTDTELRITWIKFRGEWMIRSNRKLDTTGRNYVTATKRDGSSSEERVGEYEHCFKNEDGDSHIYSICSI